MMPPAPDARVIWQMTPWLPHLLAQSHGFVDDLAWSDPDTELLLNELSGLHRMAHETM